MSAKIYLSSLREIVDPAGAMVSVFDRGFLYGDSVYETVRTAGPHVLELRRHLARLRRSADGIGMVLPFSEDHLRTKLMDTIAAADNAASRARVVVTRGTGPMALDTRLSSDPLLVIYVQELELPHAATYQRGLSAAIANPSDVAHPGLKTGNYLPNILALRQAIERAGDDAIMCNQRGLVTEGATSNVFVSRSGRLSTPTLASGLLAGITRCVVFELCEAAGSSVEACELTLDALRASDEIFLTSSVRGIMPVTRLDGAVVGTGRVGPRTSQVMGAYDDYVKRASRE
ncbi:MAG: aminotransferase class IV [Nannocystaceae bacterium]